MGAGEKNNMRQILKKCFILNAILLKVISIGSLHTAPWELSRLETSPEDVLRVL